MTILRGNQVVRSANCKHTVKNLDIFQKTDFDNFREHFCFLQSSILICSWMVSKDLLIAGNLLDDLWLALFEDCIPNLNN